MDEADLVEQIYETAFISQYWPKGLSGMAGITTVRTHLARVFQKTGTGHQSQLVALLRASIPVCLRVAR